MKKAFTLVELMIVVVVIMALLAISFRIMGTGGNSAALSMTIERLQRIENCLSGYYAAFGSYPPVALHASRNVYAELDEDGNQKEGQETSSLDARSVEAACRAQPFAARFPFSQAREVGDYIDAASRSAVDLVSDSDFPSWGKAADALSGGFSAMQRPSQAGGDWTKETNWQKIKIFQFGVMSFLLPRYLFMTKGVEPEDLEQCAQWDANNQLASHPNTGSAFINYRDQLKDKRLVVRIPSQSVCARWMPNLEGIVRGNPLESGDGSFFGIRTLDGDLALKVSPKDGPSSILENLDCKTRTVLDVMTVKDGWGREFYYYSPQPYQSYRLWSAGSNGMTFPPWVPFSTLKTEGDKRTAANWMADDIMYLSK